MPNASPSPVTADLPGRGIKPLVSLLAHPRMALAAFLLVLLAGIPVAIIKGRAMYAATATAQVSPSYMKNLRDDGELNFPSNTQYREFLQQQSKSVLRYDIVRDALRSLADRADKWRLPNESERQAVDRLRTQMAVRTIPDTYMIEISLQQPTPDGLADIVNAVVGTFVERMRIERVYGADIRQRNLETQAQERLQLIEANTARRTELALQLGISTFGDQVENPYDRVLSAQREALSEARKQRFAAEARLAAFKRRGETDITTRSVQEAVLIDPGLANLKSNLYKRRADLLIQLSGLTAAHPAYRELKLELKRIEAEIDTQIGTLTQKVSASLLARYQNGLDQARQMEADLTRELAEQEQKGARFASLYNQVMALTHDIEQDRKELDTIRARLNAFAAESNSFGFVRLLTPALPPELPFGPGRKKLLLLVLIAAFGAGLIAPIGRDLLDRRVHTVNDAERVLGIPALGWMVECSDSPSRMFGDDLLRRMAGRLIREQSEQGSRVFAFTAVKPGAGTSELVLSLGRTLTALGYPTLVVEANAFKPDARMQPDADRQPGLSQLLAGEATSAEAIIPASQDSPARLWIGDTGGRRHIDHLDGLPELFDRLRDDFRFVLVDIPPLLLSADAELLAHDLPHLVVVTEAAATLRGELTRAGHLLEKLAPAAVGMIVNRVRPFEGGGYLRELILEYLTGRKAGDYFSQPGWLTTLRAAVVTMSWNPLRLFRQAPSRRTP